MVKVKEDMTGWKMWEHGVPDSRLTVIRQDEDYVSPSGKHEATWLCECSCEEHNKIIAIGTSIKRGNTKSCGCLRKDCLKEIRKKYNEYNLSKEYGVGYCSNTGNKFYFDVSDYNLIKDYCWCEVVQVDGYHYLTAYDSNLGKLIRMHWLFGYKGYDHIDRNPLNNRRNNLRPATPQENSRNTSLRKDNTPGITGVSLHKECNKWGAKIIISEECLYLGLFENKDDAIKVRLEAEAKYYGEFAPQKHLFEQYGITVKKRIGGD